jgi:hypothetical protein
LSNSNPVSTTARLLRGEHTTRYWIGLSHFDCSMPLIRELPRFSELPKQLRA